MKKVENRGNYNGRNINMCDSSGVQIWDETDIISIPAAMVSHLEIMLIYLAHTEHVDRPWKLCKTTNE
jgi:hypothetical protein